jgi:acetyl esterase/lipase
MIAANLYLAVSMLGALATFVAASRGRSPPRLGALYWIVAWFVAETPLHHIALSAIVTMVFATLGVFAYWQGWAGGGLVLASWAVLVNLHLVARRTPAAIGRGLEGGLGPDFRSETPPDLAAAVGAQPPLERWLHPLALHDRARVERIRNLSYGPAGVRNRLDVYRPREGARDCPVLLQIHGGAWVLGDKNAQGLPLMNALAARGWVCVAPNYRLSPRATFPEHLVDCKLALRWIREHIREYGGDPSFVAVTGGSAGGHLAALVALTPNEPEYQPGFENVDTRVQAAVPFYGAYDFLFHNGVDVSRARKPSFVETHVMKSGPREDRRGWERASPIRWVNAEAPPFFVLHGANDSLVWVEGARAFVAALRQASRQPVAYAELQGAQHAFDVLHSLRCESAVDGVAAFLEWVRARRARTA